MAMDNLEAQAREWEVRYGSQFVGAPDSDRCALLVALLRHVRAEAIEACAKIAEEQESPWSTEHPEEAYVSRLQGIVGSVLIGSGWDRGDDNEPEHAIAVAIYEFLKTGQTGIDKLFGQRPISVEIRALTAEAEK